MAAPTPTSASLIADHAYQELRHRIVTLKLRPGTALREDQLMAELGIGRTPLREAVKRLSHESLVAIQPRRGTFVSDVDAADIVHITEVRAELEGFAAALASRRMQPAGRQRAEAMLREIEELGRGHDQDALMQADERIHHFVWEESGNPYLVTTLERYYALSLRVWYVVLDRVPGLGHAVHDQSHLLEALLARDASRAQRIMREHVQAFQREILAAYSRAA
ncbi:MAG TPA: GntR family transcriptional regulator [Solirubrobacteraceae bacterium]|nr:GntR family transcriptional regulator [Solirubrobacteraceae bacterium]